MISYNPGVNDVSGQILGRAAVGAAETTANANVGLVNDIGGALVSLAGAYGEMEGNKAKGRAFKDVFKVISPSMGMSLEQLESVSGGKLKSDTDWYNASQVFQPMMPALINRQYNDQRLGVQQNRPIIDAGIKNANTQAEEGQSFDGTALPRFGNK